MLLLNAYLYNIVWNRNQTDHVHLPSQFIMYCWQGAHAHQTLLSKPQTNDKNHVKSNQKKSLTYEQREKIWKENPTENLVQFCIMFIHKLVQHVLYSIIAKRHLFDIFFLVFSFSILFVRRFVCLHFPESFW